jgi:hypothetical protein
MRALYTPYFEAINPAKVDKVVFDFSLESEAVSCSDSSEYPSDQTSLWPV